MAFQEFVDATLHYIQAHHTGAALLICALAFSESLAIIALLVPVMAILFGCGALIGSGHLQFLPIWLSASIGSMLGDFVSYWLGFYYHEQIRAAWPLKKYPKLYLKCEKFFYKYGVWSIVIGRFFGPFRAVVPLIAGTVKMARLKFNLANIISAPIWAAAILAPGMFGIRWIQMITG